MVALITALNIALMGLFVYLCTRAEKRVLHVSPRNRIATAPFLLAQSEAICVFMAVVNGMVLAGFAGHIRPVEQALDHPAVPCAAFILAWTIMSFAAKRRYRPRIAPAVPSEDESEKGS